MALPELNHSSRGSNNTWLFPDSFKPSPTTLSTALSTALTVPFPSSCGIAAAQPSNTVIIGYKSDATESGNTVVGSQSYADGPDNIIVGCNNRIKGAGNIVITNNKTFTGNNTLIIGFLTIDHKKIITLILKNIFRNIRIPDLIDITVSYCYSPDMSVDLADLYNILNNKSMP